MTPESDINDRASPLIMYTPISERKKSELFVNKIGDISLP